MNRLGDAPTDLLFGLIALQNDLIAPEVISAALQAQAYEPDRTLGELLVTQGPSLPRGATWSRRSRANSRVDTAAIRKRASPL